MKIAMCDDENEILISMRERLVKYYSNPDKLYIDEFTSGEQFLSKYEPNRYDVIILDIEMKDISGLAVAEIIRRDDKDVILVFFTNHQEFALNGYEVNAFCYLLKDQPDYLFKKQLLSIFDEYSQKHMIFPFKTANRVCNVSVSDILYFEIFKRIIVLHTNSENYEFGGKLSEIEKDEKLINFIKTHKSYYVNMNHIANIDGAIVHMKNGDELPLSRGKKQIVMDQFISFLTARC